MMQQLVWEMSENTTEQQRNGQAMRKLYHLADATSKNTAKFVSMFADGVGDDARACALARRCNEFSAGCVPAWKFDPVSGVIGV
jgi:hypothetical protein